MVEMGNELSTSNRNMDGKEDMDGRKMYIQRSEKMKVDSGGKKCEKLRREPKMKKN
jgi:hypothetical protein